MEDNDSAWRVLLGQDDMTCLYQLLDGVEDEVLPRLEDTHWDVFTIDCDEPVNSNNMFIPKII